jgi:hypothetical protein
MTPLQIILLGLQLWIRSFLPVLGILVLLFVFLGAFNVELEEVWETVICIAVYFPLSLMGIDYSFKKIAYKKYNLEFKKFIGWSILWRTSLLLAIIGGFLLLIPQYHQLDIVARGLLPFILSIPILGLIANYFLRKHSLKIHISKEKNGNQPIYDRQIYRLAIISFVLSLIWLAGVGSLIAIISGRKALKLMKRYESKVIGDFPAKFGYIAGWIGLCLWGGIFLLIILMVMRGK